MLRWTLAAVLALAGCDQSVGGRDAGPEPSMDATTSSDASTTDATPEDAATPSCAAGSVRIEERCEPELVPCGGAVLGEHCYTEVCIEKDELLAEPLMEPGVPPGCTAAVLELRGSTGTIAGSIAFTETEVARRITTTVTGTFWLPPECQVVPEDCAVTEAWLNGALPPYATATCAADAGGCECDVELESTLDDSDSYTIEGNTIVTGGGRRADYCVEADGALRFREDSATGGEPGTRTVLPSGG